MDDKQKGLLLVAGLGLALAASMGFGGGVTPPPPPPPGKANLYGLVKDSATSLPLEGVLVGLALNPGPNHEDIGIWQTATDGTFLITDLLPGNYLIVFDKEGYTPLTR